MNTLSLLISGKRYDYTAPSNWNELTEKQLILWAAISIKHLSPSDALRLSMMVMYDIPRQLFKQIPDSQLAQLAPTLRFLFEDNKLSKWVIKELKDQRLYGPTDRLESMTIGEFAKTELYYQVYVKKNNKAALDLLIAALYRPKHTGQIDKDIREPLTEYGTRQRAEQMAKLPAKLRQAILLNYEGCRNQIRSKYLDKLPKSNAAKSDEIFDYNKTILTVAGGKFGTKSETEKAQLYDFLQHLIDTAEDVERIKKK